MKQLHVLFIRKDLRRLKHATDWEKLFTKCISDNIKEMNKKKTNNPNLKMVMKLEQTLHQGGLSRLSINTRKGRKPH